MVYDTPSDVSDQDDATATEAVERGQDDVTVAEGIGMAHEGCGGEGLDILRSG